MKIICIGRNYTEHAQEMKAEVPSEPVFFMKPDTALLKENQDFYYPDFSKEIHHEIEIVIKISKPGKCIQAQFAHKYFDEVSLGIDFTARDLQAQCKAKGLPWEKAKAFDGSAPIGKFVKKENLNLSKCDFKLGINGNTVQSGNSSDMIFSVEQIISYVSQYVTLKTGDLIFTGTPAGVGPVKIGDRLSGYLNGDEMFDFLVK
jgi:acylpyruvate hydrolase